jgi:hypothetical protein
LALLLVLCAAGIIGYTLLAGDDGDPSATEQVAIVQTEAANATSTAAASSASPTPAATTEESSPTATDTVAVVESPTAMATGTATTAATNTPTIAPTHTPNPTATSTTPPTQPPTDTPTAQAALSSQITGITLEGGVYVVSYQTSGFTESLPGLHVHFFFDTVSAANAGVPGSGPWILYGGPRPFRQYTAADRPSGASQMCILVANPDHSVQAGSGNCYPLPG